MTDQIEQWSALGPGEFVRYPSQASGGDGTLYLIELGALAVSDRGDFKIRTPDAWVWRTETAPEVLQELANNGTVVLYDVTQDPALTEAKVDQMLADMSFEPLVFLFRPNSASAPPNPALLAMVEDYYNQSFADVVVVGSHLGQYDPDPQFQQGDRDYQLAYNLNGGFLSPTGLLGDQPAPQYHEEQELIVLVGQPGSGKSTFLQTNPPPEQYVIVERKGSRERYLAQVQRALEEGLSVIIDATNPGEAERKDFIRLATQMGLPVRIWWSARPGRPYNELRPASQVVPDVALRIYTSRFQRPVAEPDRNITVERIG